MSGVKQSGDCKNRNSHIEEMAKDLCDSTMCDLETYNNCRMPQGNCSRCKRVAEDLYNAGYRKQSENIIELPCKVGATLYFLYNKPYADKPDLTPRICKTTDWYFKVGKKGIVIYTSDIHGFNKKYGYYLGETVFLTRKEAEAKMEGGE